MFGPSRKIYFRQPGEGQWLLDNLTVRCDQRQYGNRLVYPEAYSIPPIPLVVALSYKRYVSRSLCSKLFSAKSKKLPALQWHGQGLWASSGGSGCGLGAFFGPIGTTHDHPDSSEVRSSIKGMLRRVFLKNRLNEIIVCKEFCRSHPSLPLVPCLRLPL